MGQAVGDRSGEQLAPLAIVYNVLAGLGYGGGWVHWYASRGAAPRGTCKSFLVVLGGLCSSSKFQSALRISLR